MKKKYWTLLIVGVLVVALVIVLASCGNFSLKDKDLDEDEEMEDLADDLDLDADTTNTGSKTGSTGGNSGKYNGGSGNNGGDGLVMARAAAKDGWRVVVLLAEGDPKTPDAMTNYARLADLPVTKCRDAAALAAQPFDAVVDALYGTGFHGSLRPAGLAACALMNRQRESGTFVLAVDLPSGINTDTGEAAEGAVRADLTVTFDSCKPLHTAPSSAPFCGEIVCADIGIRDEWHPAGLAQL